MRILVLHNRYQQPGGEEFVVSQEIDLLRDHGHEVIVLEKDNKSVVGGKVLVTAAQSVWNHSVYQEIRKLVQEHQIDLVHIHNYFPLLSASAFRAAADAGAAVVHTLHNFRMFCMQSALFRDGQLCVSCLDAGSALPGVLNRCYRKSWAGSLVSGFAQEFRNRFKILLNSTDVFIVPNQAAIELLVAHGLPETQFKYKPHFLFKDPGVGDGSENSVVYAGRFEAAKGIMTLLQAWQGCFEDRRLKLAGVGELDDLERICQSDASIEPLGWLSTDGLTGVIGKAKLLVVPSVSSEMGPIVLIQAYAVGTPVLAARNPFLVPSVEEGVTGLFFEPDSPESLRKQLLYCLSNQTILDRMRVAARERFLRCYSVGPAYQKLMETYETALALRRVKMRRL